MIRNLLMIGLFCWSGFSFAQSMSLSDFLDLAERKDKNFERILSEKAQLKYIIDAGLPAQALLVTAKQEYGFSSDNGDRTSELTVGASKKILSTGSELSITQERTDLPDRNEELTEIRLEQALLNNFFGVDNRLKVQTLELQKKLIYLQILEAYESYLSEMTKLYLDYSQSKIELSLAEELFQEAKQLQNNVLNMRSKNIANSTDVARAKLQALLAKEDVLNKSMAYETLKEQLKARFGAEFEPPAANLDLSNHLVLPLKTQLLNLSNLRAVQALDVEEKVAESNLTLARRDLRPDLDLLLGYNLDRSRRFNTSVNREEAVVGLSLTMPIGDDGKRAEKQRTSMLLLQSKLDGEIKKKEIKAQEDVLVSRLSKTSEQLELSKEKTKLTEQIFRDEKRRYQRGALDLERLIETRQDLSTYKFKYQSDLVAHNKAIVDWLEFTDKLLRKDPIKDH